MRTVLSILLGNEVKLGNLILRNGLLSAPMAGITDQVFRHIARESGCELVYAEMVSAEGIARNSPASRKYIDSTEDERPLGVQLFGSNPETMAEAARIVEQSGADLIDINMGCPVKKVVKTGAGAALIKDERRVGAIVRKIKNSSQLPLTAKIRSGWGSCINFLQIGRILESEGVNGVIIHPRTAEQAFSGMAKWEHIGELKSALRIPVIGNGDIRSAEDACRMKYITGCDGIMIGRGALGNPWIFENTLRRLAGQDEVRPGFPEIETMIKHHCNLLVSLYGRKKGLRHVRRHIQWYTRGLRWSSHLRKDIQLSDSPSGIEDAISRFFVNQTKMRAIDCGTPVSCKD